jgi:hypothetical protein
LIIALWPSSYRPATGHLPAFTPHSQSAAPQVKLESDGASDDVKLYLSQHPPVPVPSQQRTAARCDPNQVVMGPDGPENVKCATAQLILRDVELPKFSWPPPTPSEKMNLPHNRVVEGLGKSPALSEISRRLTTVLDSAGYSEYSFYRVPDGFAVVARMEQIEPDGTPLSNGYRFMAPDAASQFSLSSYLEQLFVAPQGYYRLIVFIVTDVAIVAKGPTPRAVVAESWLSQGADKLSPPYDTYKFSPNHQVSVFIYEYRKRGSAEVLALIPGRIDVATHLKKSGLYAGLMDRAH